jgi:hypothetical protein
MPRIPTPQRKVKPRGRYSDADRARWHLEAQRALKRVREREALWRAKREAQRRAKGAAP